MDEDVLDRINDEQNRRRVLIEFNQSTLDPVGPLGGDQGMKVLSEMNFLADEHDQFVKSLAPRAEAP